MILLTENLTSKLKLFISGSIFCLLVISSYLLYLQHSLSSKYLSKSQNNFLRTEIIEPIRGNITDINGKLLATNQPKDTIYWIGTGNRKLSKKQIKIIEKISSKYNLDQIILNQVQIAERKSYKFPIIKNANFDQISYINENFAVSSNILVQRSFTRIYPFESSACHIIGYLGRIDKSGKLGLEHIYNDVLKGKSGKLKKEINSTGCNLKTKLIQEPISGTTIQSTINIDLQVIAENLFPKNSNGACILIDPKTGAQEVVFSMPNFDANIFLKPISNKNWKNLIEKNCFINRAFSACYPPASIFKLITLATALETNIINSNSIWNCKGYIKFGKRFIYCNKWGGHGKIGIKKALAQSCNIPFFDIAQKISIDRLAEFSEKFGLNKKTNICFNENSGLIPTSQWKIKTKGERWWPGETISASIGQSFLLVTPIQAACLISSIHEGYLVKPRIVVNEKIEKKPLDLSRKTRSFLKMAMKAAVKSGTAKKLNNLKNFKIYAKTGTAQTIDLRRKKIIKQHLSHTWLAVYFQYKNHPPRTLVILIENEGTIRTAINIAEKFLLKYEAYFNKNYPIKKIQ